MTVQQLHIGLELGLQQLNSNLFNRLEPEEKDYLLNEGVNLYLSSILNNVNETNVLSYNDIINKYSSIHTLIRVGQCNSIEDDDVFDIDFNWYHIFRIDAITDDDKVIPVRLLQSEDISSDNIDSYGTSDFSIIGEIINDEIHIISGNLEIAYIKVVYVDQPTSINYETGTPSNLPEKTHYDIINITINSITQKYMMKNAAATGQLPSNK